MMNLETLKRDQGSTYVASTTVVMTTQLGREERQLQVVTGGEVMKEPCYVLPLTGMDEGMEDVTDE